MVLRPGAGIDLASVIAHCRKAGLAAQKLPEQLEVVAEMPRNASGKILKHVLQKQLTSNKGA